MATSLRRPALARVPPHPQPDDMALITAIAARDQAAFATLYDRHSASAYALAYHLLGERGAAETVVEDVFLALWRTPGNRDRPHGNVRARLLTQVWQSARRRRAASDHDGGVT